MKKTDSKKIMTYVLLLGLVALLGVYFLVYKKYIDATEVLENQNRTLRTRVAELKEYYDNIETYNAEMDSMLSEVKADLDEFPADVKEEDMLVLALDTMKKAEIGYTGISISERTGYYEIPEETVKGAEDEDLTEQLKFISRTTQYVNTVDYANLKNTVKTILESDEKKNINLITYSRNNDETALEGTISVTFFYATGTGKEYVDEKFPTYESGLIDLFKLVEIEEDDTTNGNKLKHEKKK